MEVKVCCLWFNALSGCANIWHFWLVMSHVISCLDSVTRFGKFGLIHLMCTAADTTKLRLITLPFYFFAKPMFFQPTPRNKFTQPVNLSLLWICTTVQLISCHSSKMLAWQLPSLKGFLTQLLSLYCGGVARYIALNTDRCFSDDSWHL